MKTLAVIFSYLIGVTGIACGFSYVFDYNNYANNVFLFYIWLTFITSLLCLIFEDKVIPEMVEDNVERYGRPTSSPTWVKQLFTVPNTVLVGALAATAHYGYAVLTVCALAWGWSIHNKQKKYYNKHYSPGSIDD